MKEMNKKAQITIFIIIALVIVAAIILFFAIKGNVLSQYFKGKSGELIQIPPQVEEINTFVFNCIERTGYEAVYIISQHGGYANPPKNSFEFGIPYYYKDGKSYIPSKNRIEKEISEYINENIVFCTELFLGFPDFNIIESKMNTTAIIKDNEVIINTNYPLTINKLNSTFYIKDFKNIKIYTKLGLIYNLSSDIAMDIKNDNQICLNCIIDFSEKYNISVNTFNYGNSTIFVIKDKDFFNNIDNSPYEFKFAIKP